jgi:hypothetical protein
LGWLCKNPNAIPILEKHLDKVYWEYLSENPNAIPILEKYPDNKLNWRYLSRNSYDYLPQKIMSFNKLNFFTTDFKL